MAATFDLLEQSPAVTYAACGGIWTMVLTAPCNAADMLLARPSLAKMLQREPAGFPTLTWILPAAGINLPADARKAAAEITAAFDAHNRGRATIIEGTGFGAAAIRSIIAGIDMVSRTTQPGQVFAAVPEAVAWCVRLRALGARDTASVDDIVAALDAGVRPLRR
jgi:hypothetical protein